MKKDTGIKRKIDDLGRIVIPMEIRNALDINEGDFLEIFIDRKSIILQKDYMNCIFCGNEKNLIDYKEQKICDKCFQELIGGKYNGKIKN